MWVTEWWLSEDRRAPPRGMGKGQIPAVSYLGATDVVRLMYEPELWRSHFLVALRISSYIGVRDEKG